VRPADNSAVSETHIGVVLFTEERAYKIKKR
jgi:aminoglycoside phosphotransferase family enzyme